MVFERLHARLGEAMLVQPKVLGLGFRFLSQPVESLGDS